MATDEEKEYFEKAIDRYFGHSPDNYYRAKIYAFGDLCSKSQYGPLELMKDLSLLDSNFMNFMAGSRGPDKMLTPESIIMLENNDFSSLYKSNKAVLKQTEEHKDKIDSLNDLTNTMVASLDKKDLQINNLTEDIKKLTTQNNELKTELEATTGKLYKISVDFDELKDFRDMVCSSGVFKCHGIGGELPPEPEL